MLGKLLKKDLASMIKLWLILALSSLGASLLAGIASTMLRKGIPDALMVMLVLIMMLSLMIIPIFLVLTQVLIFVRFYRNFYTDEGYLTFTLPVKRSTLFNSKVLAAVILESGSAIIYALCIVMISLFIPEINIFDIFPLIPVDMLPFMFIYIIEITTMTLVASLIFVLLVYAAITFAAVIVKRVKVLVAIAMIYGAYSVFSVIFVLGGTIFAPSLSVALSEFMSTAPDTVGNIFIAILLLVIIVAEALIASALYIFTLGKIERKLNLP